MDQLIVTLETSPTTAALDEALAKAQGEINTADKDKVNPAFKSRYADLTSVWAACRPALSKNSIALTQWPLSSGDNRLHIITRLAHKGEWMQARFSIPLDKANAHGVGSAITYAKRFTLSAALGVVADDDDDGNAASKADQGSAGSGGEFRPAGRRPLPYSTSEATAEAVRDGLTEGAAPKPAAGPAAPRTNGNGKKALTPEERSAKAKQWVDNAIGTLNLSGQTVDSLSQFRSTSAAAIEWLEHNAPAEHDRFEVAYDDKASAARALVAT